MRTKDENAGKSVAGRLSVEVAEGLFISGNFSHHDHERDDGTTGRGTAFGADLEYGTFRNGTHFQIGVIGGDNWRAEDPVTGDDPTFLTGQAILSHYLPVESTRFEGVEPLIRLSWGDPNRDGDDNGGFLVTPGVFVYVLGRNRIGANLDVYSPQTGDTEFSFKLQTYLFY